MTYAKKVLLVEDDAFTRFMIKEMISDLGVDADVASDGRDAIDKLDKSPRDFGLVLMDIHMPNFSGLEAVKSIRKSKKERARLVPIMAHTSDRQFHSQAVAEEHGMNGYAPKPVTPGKLLALIDKYCA